MRKISAAVLALAGVWTAAAQSRISPRIARSGGSSYLVVFEEGADMQRARRELTRRGFDLLDHPDLRSNHLLAGGPRFRLASIEDLDGLVYVLPASTDLLTRRHVLACAGALTRASAAPRYVLAGQGWPAGPDGVASVRFGFESLPSNLDEGASRAEIERALREWEKCARLSLESTTTLDGPRTIHVRFARGAHGDPYTFDGRGGMLAHTFYPPPLNQEPLAGDMHFDADEVWNIGVSVDLFSVALHEAGHALGLGHSDEPGAVMYPYYRQAYGLTSDDIAAIQSIYGARGSAPGPSDPPPTPPTPPVAPPPDPPVTGPPPASGADHSSPTVRITSPPSAAYRTSATSIDLAGTAGDDVGVTAVRWTTSAGDAGVAVGTTSWSARVPLYPGANVVTVRAYDAAGNSSWRAITVSRR